MSSFETVDAKYTVDTENQLISGGVFGNIFYEYINLKVIKGLPALIQLKDSRVIKTGEILKCA